MLLLVALATVQAGVRVTESHGEWRLENRQLQVLVRPMSGTILVRDRPSGREWGPSPSDGQSRPTFRNVRRTARPGPGLAFDSRIEVGSTNSLAVSLTLPDRGSDLFVEVDLPDRHAKIQNLFVLDPFVSASTTTKAGLVVADYSNGHL